MASNSYSSKLAQFNNDFAYKLYKKLANKTNDNFFISPYSISTALSMCYIGSKNNTHKQLNSLLSYENDSSLTDEQIMKLNQTLIENLNASTSNDLSINIANKLFVKQEYDISSSYLNKLRSYFKSDIEKLDFSNSSQSAKIINEWVSKQTNDKIKNLIDQNVINTLTRLILINAIYFKGNWLNKFEKTMTQKDNFHLENGSSVKVDMMKLLNKKFKYKSNLNGLDASACELPYFGDKISMTILLPNNGTKLSKIEERLNSNILNEILNSHSSFVKVHLHLPKFKLENKIELSNELSSLGASDAFSEDKANFSGISPENDLYISNVIHQAVVEVNEEGTEAAAATAVVMMTKSLALRPDPIIEFKCDRPFLFIIHEKESNCILFMGKLNRP